ncbi:IMP dehydrogenase [Patescibacteria group bacterium]|nr:IMP dehydrogenase [Patescibacteria group bacterium]MBU1967306.1 IMP dehydrogenase [Patescibacteria group bacterium]
MPNIPLNFAYDDVLLTPRRSTIKHRTDVDTTTWLTPEIVLKTPFISANMDTVTEAPMAIAMAKSGGLGIIHRFMSIKEQAKQVNWVSRYEGFLIDQPYTISPNKTIRHILEKVNLNQVSSYLVINTHRQLLGLVTRRDIIFAPNPDLEIKKAMTPLSKLILGKPGTSLKKAKKIFAQHKIEKLPIVDQENRLLGLITARSILNYEKNPQATIDSKGRLMCGAAVGVVGDYLERAEVLLQAGANIIVVDVAHGQNEVSLEAIKKIRKKFPSAPIMGGNVATAAGVRDLVRAGANCIKIGIGPGGICSTRTVTGVGVPQFSAVLACAKEAKKHQVTVVADGGTNYPGDITKALAAGAAAVMLAGWFAGTDQSPGKIIIRKNRRYKIHRGSASFMSQIDSATRQQVDKNVTTIVPEGVEALIEYKGSVAEIIYQLLGGLRSGMSYCNAKNIAALQKNAQFIRMTWAGFNESLTHNINEI